MNFDSVTHDTLGRLVWEEDSDWWFGETEIAAGATVEIFVLPRDTSNEIAIERAAIALGRIRESHAVLKMSTAEALLGQFNEYWNDKEPINAAAFGARITLNNIVIHGDGTAELSYNDGAHILSATLDPTGAIVGTAIVG